MKIKIKHKTPQNEQKRPKFARYGKRGEIIPLILQRRIRAARGITERIEKNASNKEPALEAPRGGGYGGNS